MNNTAINFQTIAVDFDGTLCYSKWPDCGQPNQALITYLQEWRRNGNKLILWTCRAGEALTKAIDWCREQNLEFDAVNDNLPEIIELYGNNSRKITCDYYIDDRMLLPESDRRIIISRLSVLPHHLAYGSVPRRFLSFHIFSNSTP